MPGTVHHLDGVARPASVRWVSNQHQRWGSCTPVDGTIRLSDRMRGMPDHESPDANERRRADERIATTAKNMAPVVLTNASWFDPALVPPSAGLFSSFGLLYAEVEHHYARTFRRLLRKADLSEIEAAWSELARQAFESVSNFGEMPQAAEVRSSLLRLDDGTYVAR